MLYYLAVALYVIICLFLTVVVLLQPGRADGMGAALGGGGTSTGSVFGGRGASNVLTRMTTGAAVLFMVLSIVLARASADHSSVDGSTLGAPATAGAGVDTEGAGDGAAGKKAAPGAKPTAEAAKPAAEPAKPAPEAAKPAAEPVKPAPEAAKPAAEPVKPAPEAAKPAAEPATK